jgi:hypothetical protein
VTNAIYSDEGQNPPRLGDCEGSKSIDRLLLEAARFLINERVEIHNIEAGAHCARGQA